MRLAPLPTIALFVALSVTGCSSGHDARVPVPWVNRPLPRYEVPAPQVIPYPTSAPPCHASELRISQGRGGAAAGTLYERLVLTNIGGRTCLLRGYPTISALGPDGTLYIGSYDNGLYAIGTPLNFIYLPLIRK